MPQDPADVGPHRSHVLKPAIETRRSIDPAARRSKRAYDGLSSSAVGIEMGLSVVIGVLGGMWLDGRFGTTPWLMIAFMMFGLVAGLRSVLRAVKRAERAAARG